MKQAYAIFTKTRFGLDVRIWVTMIVAAIISTAILGFKMATNVECVDFDIYINAGNTTQNNNYYIGETITFKASISSQKIVWDFGDHSKQEEGTIVNHLFLHEGNYSITATINGKCPQLAAININRQFIVERHDTASAIPSDSVISGLGAVNTGVQSSYVSLLNASAYKWTIEFSDIPPQFTKDAVFKFSGAGTKNIILQLDNDPKKIFRKTIIVSDKPDNGSDLLMPVRRRPQQQTAPQTQPVVTQPAPVQPAPQQPVAPPKPTVKYMPDDQYVNMFKAIAERQNGAGVQNFIDCQCLVKGTATRVNTNYQENLTVESFCEKCKTNRKKIKIKTVQVNRDVNVDHTVNNFYIEY